MTMATRPSSRPRPDFGASPTTAKTARCSGSEWTPPLPTSPLLHSSPCPTTTWAGGERRTPSDSSTTTTCRFAATILQLQLQLPTPTTTSGIRRSPLPPARSCGTALPDPHTPRFTTPMTATRTSAKWSTRMSASPRITSTHPSGQ